MIMANPVAEIRLNTALRMTFFHEERDCATCTIEAQSN